MRSQCNLHMLHPLWVQHMRFAGGSLSALTPMDCWIDLI